MGKRVSFEIVKDSVEGLTHRTERTEENEVQADLDTKVGPLTQLEDKAIKDKAESTLVEKGNNAIKRVGTNIVDSTHTSRAKGRSRDELPMTIDL